MKKQFSICLFGLCFLFACNSECKDEKCKKEVTNQKVTGQEGVIAKNSEQDISCKLTTAELQKRKEAIIENLKKTNH